MQMKTYRDLLELTVCFNYNLLIIIVLITWHVHSSLLLFQPTFCRVPLISLSPEVSASSSIVQELDSNGVVDLWLVILHSQQLSCRSDSIINRLVRSRLIFVYSFLHFTHRSSSSLIQACCHFFVHFGEWILHLHPDEVFLSNIH